MLGLNEDPPKYTLPTLYKRTSTGAVTKWTVHVIENVVTTTHGQVDGKIQTTSDTVREGKNAGKSNATTPAEQAIKQAHSKWEKQTKKGYVQELTAAERGDVDESVIEGGIPPMLAPSAIYPKFAHKPQWPVFTQPKLDGMRCLAILEDGKCTLWSRTRKRIGSMVHIERQIEALFMHVVALEASSVGTSMENAFRSSRTIFDGELFVAGVPFEDVLSWIRTDEPGENSHRIEYHVYDFPTNPKCSFSVRWAALRAIGGKFEKVKASSLFLVPTQTAANAQEELEQHEANLAALH